MQEELGEAQGGARRQVEKGVSFGIKAKSCSGECKMGEEPMVRSFITKYSHRTKAKMAIVKAEKVIAKEVRLAKQTTTTKLSLPKSFPKHQKVKGKRPLGPST
jgi:hypothetical protein